MKTILITGCSSGFGLEIAKHFLDRGWKVIATMRVPNDNLVPQSEHLKILPLDVTDSESIRAAIDAAGPIDALVNNAGIGFLNASFPEPQTVGESLSIAGTGQQFQKEVGVVSVERPQSLRHNFDRRTDRRAGSQRNRPAGN